METDVDRNSASPPCYPPRGEHEPDVIHVWTMWMKSRGHMRTEDFQDTLEKAGQAIDELKAALNEIRDSRFCNYENSGTGSYGIGVTDGHRYCSNVAQKAIDSVAELSGQL